MRIDQHAMSAGPGMLRNPTGGILNAKTPATRGWRRSWAVAGDQPGIFDQEILEEKTGVERMLREAAR